MKKLTLIIFSLLAICTSVNAQAFKVLVFTKTAGFRHGSIPAGIQAIQQLGSQNNFSVDATEDASQFTEQNLAQYAAIIFLSTTGDILNASQQAAFEAYIRAGGGYVGIHAASDTEYSWPWYGELVGAYFDSHPAIQEATIEVADQLHPSTNFLAKYWTRRDEWYNFNRNPRGEVHVLATLDESTYTGGNMGHDHPTAWCHEYDGGRAWYTGGGHTNASFSEANFVNHILGGILYAAGSVSGDFEATVNEKYEVTIIDNNPKSPIHIAVLPDLSVLYLERAGTMKIKDMNTGVISVAGTFSVDAGREDGLLGVVLDPDFETNNWIYIFYSPSGISVQRVSRFELVNKQLDLSSEKIMLTIPVQREECCHSGGDLEFDAQGNLYISTGDNANPFQSDGYTPIDERPGRAAFDAQGTSANTNDLRGKILRITPQADGTYTIPAGNLFTNPNDGKPEIYAMGCRNPFRIAINPVNQELVWGDIGPDAQQNSGSRGPKGYDEFNRTTTPGNFGWPYCIGNNLPYKDVNFVNGNSSGDFDCNNPRNTSPNNTGLIDLPPARPAWISYPYFFSDDIPEFGSIRERCAMAGDYYQYNPNNTAAGFPAYYDNTLFIMEWSRNWIQEVRLDESGEILQINPFLPNLELNRPIDMTFGPDGAMYIVEWGTGFFMDNPDARIIKISYQSSAVNRAPLPTISASVTSGSAPLSVVFTGDQSRDPDVGDAITFSWDLNDDGIPDSSTPNASFTYTQNGVYNVKLTVTDRNGLSAVAQVDIVVGNNAPEVDIVSPPNGSFYQDEDVVPYQVSISDPDETGVCNGPRANQVTLEPSIGHDDHSHGTGTLEGCSGSFTTEPHGDGSDDVFYVLNATYSDNGGQANYSLQGEAAHILQPKTKQAEYFLDVFDMQSESTGDFLGGGENMGFIHNNSYLKYGPMNFQDIEFLTLRFASLSQESWIELRMDALNGPVLARRKLKPTGGWQSYDYFPMELRDLGGTHEVYLIFFAPNATGDLGNINWLEFHGKGAAEVDPQANMGLTASYFNNPNFSGTPQRRKEPMIGWEWENENPVAGIGEDNFSVRWEGQIVAPTTATYTLSRERLNGTAQVWIEGQLVIPEGVNSGTFRFEQDVLYDIKVEYVHTTREAAMYLRWEGPQPSNVIHTQFFRSPATPTDIDQIEELQKQIYPNPVKNQLFVPDVFQGEAYTFWNLAGQKVLKGKVNGEIDVEDLLAGLYILEIKGYRFKVVKD